MNIKQAALTFLNTDSVSQNVIYDLEYSRASHTECAVVPDSAEEFKMGVYQKYDGNIRFISIDSRVNEILFVSTPFKPFKDNTLRDYFVFPSDSVPDMLRGGYMKIKRGKPEESFLQYHKVTWRNAECEKNYYLVALADQIIHKLDKVEVKRGKDDEWVIGNNFEAIQKGIHKKSLLRLLFQRNPSGEVKVIIMGFNRQSLTINISQPFRSSYNVDEQSLWRMPAKPHQRESMIDYDHQFYAFSNVRGDTRTLIWVKHYFQVYFWDRKFNLLQVFYKRDDYRTGDVVITGTPQIETGYNYRNWLFRTVHFPDRFHEVFKSRAHLTTPQFGYIFTVNQPNMDLDNIIVDPESEFRYFIVIWDTLIGRTCKRYTDGEEVYIAPNFQLMSFEGDYTPSSLKITKAGSTEIEGCALV
jgi:hypothetical protein